MNKIYIPSFPYVNEIRGEKRMDMNKSFELHKPEFVEQFIKFGLY